MSQKSEYTYKESGVDTQATNAFTDDINHIATQTHSKNVIGEIGDFASLYQLPKDYKQPVLVSSTDGVGTKLKLAIDHDTHDCIGIDLVAMCVNDLITKGAKPLFFLDYIACQQFDTRVTTMLLNGISKGCKLSGMALVGGETAEMPDMYHHKHYDLAGFSVGVVEKNKILSAQNTHAEDVLLALPSSGFHANGYTLIRHIIKDQNINLATKIDQKSILEHLMQPTHIYVQVIQELLSSLPIKAIANITGGGITENLPRSIRSDLTAKIDLNSWELPAVFRWLQTCSNMKIAETLKTFNNGVGMIVVFDKQYQSEALKITQSHFSGSWIIGKLEERKNQALEYNGLLK